jgi:DNA processing protein
VSEPERLRLAFVGMHPARCRGLVARLGSAGDVVAAVAAGSIRVPAHARRAAGLTEKQCRAALDGCGVRPVFRGGDGYPEHLARLPDAPDVLFVRGDLPASPGVAVVGTRRCTRYGEGLAAAYGRALSGTGWPVITGLARGVDGAAHRGAVGGGGAAVAVLGCGPDVVYPPEHAGLLDEAVAAGGAMATEYPPGVPPSGWRFPPRNRIISGLAAAVVVVEAPERGGALITAAAALCQGRTVLAVPGDVGRRTSRGCNLLIRDGAVPVLEPADLVEALSLVSGLQPPRREPGSTERRPLLEVLGPAGATLDELAEVWEVPASEAMRLVARLEAEGVVAVGGGVVTAVDR